MLLARVAFVPALLGSLASCADDATGPPGGDDLGTQEFVWIAAGTFQMGSAAGSGRERPVHTVNITKPFYLQKAEVTQGQWGAVMGRNPSAFLFCGDACPVESVSWTDVQEFIAKLNSRNPRAKYRLPTEAEWEYAARAGTAGDYGGTGVLDDMAWYWRNSAAATHPVALKNANAWGLYDMHGNVWEWVQDWYVSNYYGSSPPLDPPGPDSGSYRVLRGGSWAEFENSARSAYRGFNFPSSTHVSIGLRLARSP